MEFVLFRDEQDLQDLYRRFVAGLTVRSRSLLDSNTQYVIVRKEATNNTQLFAHELTHAAVTICFPGARPWLHEGMASFYETAQVRDGKLVLGMPAYGFVAMTNVEPTRDIYSVYVNGTTVLMLPPRLVPDFDELRTMDPVAFAFLGRSRSPSELRLTTAHYAGSWHAVHLLQFGDRTLHPRFRTYLTRLAEGDDDDRAWDSAFYGVDVAARYRDYLLLIAEDPEAAFEELNKSLTLDATSWRTYAFAGRALEELGRTGPALRAYQTAIALTEDAPDDSRDMLRLKVKRLRAERDALER